PGVSNEGARGRMPCMDSDWDVGLKAAIPQYAAGRMTDAAVCVPMLQGTVPDATAAAEPALDPPGVRSRSQGFRVGGGPLKYAYSVVWTLPRMMAPAARSELTI